MSDPEPHSVEWLRERLEEGRQQEEPGVERVYVPTALEEAQANLRRSRQAARIIRWLGLVSFDKIATWCARTPGGPTGKDEQRRQVVLGELIEAARDGAFGPPDHPTIAYLSGVVPHKSWLTRVRLLPRQIGFFGPEHVYVQKPAAAQWFADHGYPVPPWLLGVEPRRPAVSTIEGNLAPPVTALAPPIGASEQADVPDATASRPRGKKRGPKGGLTEKATAAILIDLRSGAETIASLDAAKQDDLKMRYEVGSRATVTKALKQAVSQFKAV